MEGAEVRAWLRVRTSAAMKPSALLWYGIDSLRVFEHTAVSSATSSDILCKMYSKPQGTQTIQTEAQEAPSI